jgi:L-aspartate oxidase
MHVTGDFLIVGSGIAGLRAATELADAGDVIMLTKAEPGEGSTGYAQGGIAAALGDDDSPALHARDTIEAGDGLCDERAVRVLVEDGPRYLRQLVAWGARFDQDARGRLELAREGAHSVRRVVHARDTTGREIERTLWTRTARSRVRVLTHTLATAVVLHDGRSLGMRFLLPDGTEGVALAGATLLATGGSGRVFRETTNPAVATGDGVSIAYHAGARVTDLEFVQFHPTVLNVPGAPRFLISEALRGEGARLVNEAGEAFMLRHHPSAELAPRDVVARAIADEARKSGGVYLRLSHLDAGFVRSRFPLIAETCAQHGLDLARDPIRVGPAAHYVMGGVETDLDGRTSIPGLFAAGETACTGVHGANRLASNSLLEGLVFGARAGAAMKRERAAAGLRATDPAITATPRRIEGAGADIEDRVRALQDLMWTRVGLFRDRASLADAVAALDDEWRNLEPDLDGSARRDSAACRLASVVTVGRLIAHAALRREESRGAHFRSDFPARDDLHWKRHVTDERDDRRR